MWIGILNYWHRFYSFKVSEVAWNIFPKKKGKKIKYMLMVVWNVMYISIDCWPGGHSSSTFSFCNTAMCVRTAWMWNRPKCRQMPPQHSVANRDLDFCLAITVGMKNTVYLSPCMKWKDEFVSWTPWGCPCSENQGRKKKTKKKLVLKFLKDC